MWNFLASSMDYYMQKTFYKTASLMANSCKSIAVVGGQPQEVALHAFDYGRHLVCSSCSCLDVYSAYA
jgi:geranylgeranyl pyrophosphate synthase